MKPDQFIRSVASGLKESWRRLVVADVLFKLLAFVLLTPVFLLLWRSLLTLSGHSVMSDVDIAMFFAGPFGWFCAIALGAVWAAIVALEQASLLFILAGRSAGKIVSATSSIRFALGHAIEILSVAARMIGWTLIAIAPFLLIAGGVYFWLLDEYDINYYLQQRPSEFKISLAVGASLAIVLAAILLRFYSSWFFALPLVLFDQTPVKESLTTSGQMVVGHRRRILVLLVVWLGVLFTANILVTAVVGGVGRVLIPSSVGSPYLLATRVGLLLMIIAAAGLLLNLLATILFAGILFRSYEEINPKSSTAIARRLKDHQVDNANRFSFVTGTRLAAGSIIAALVAALIGYWSMNSLSLEDDVQIMAHRGSSFAAPENTMAAFREAIEKGADWIEIDVQETADGEVVVLHDSDFMKLSGNPLKIWDATVDELSDIDIGSWLDPKFSGERVATLAQVLQLCKGKVGVNIELKYYGHDDQLEKRVVEIVEAEGMADQVMVMSLKPDGLAKMKALRPSWKCGLLLSVYVGDLAEIKADFLAVNSQFASRNFVDRAHESNKQVFVWTVNDAATMSQALNRNVDGILTDRPGLAKEVLKERSQMSSAERLLAELSLLFNQPSVAVKP